MRFPIIKKKLREWSKIEDLVNIPHSLYGPLEDIGVLVYDDDIGWWVAKQDYYDLPIDEGPLFGLLSEFFDFKGDFRIGCTGELAPPYFFFIKEEGASDTTGGKYVLFYERDLKLSTFLEYRSLRNLETRNRDLLRLSNAYNQLGNYLERVEIRWHGYAGEEKPRFYSELLKLEFEGEYLTYASRCRLSIEKENPHPLCGHIMETRLAGIISIGDPDHNRLNPSLLQESGFSADDLLYGVMEVATRIFPAKKDLGGNEALVLEAAKSFKLAPQDFDPYNELQYIREDLGVYL